MARAPPEPPSPVTIDITGTFRPNIALKLYAIVSPAYNQTCSFIPKNYAFAIP